MDTTRYLEAVTGESARLGEVASTTLGTAIPFLGAWTVGDLVAHTGAVYAFATANIVAASDHVSRAGDEAQAADGDGLNDWFAMRRTALLDALRSADPEALSWSIAGVRATKFWFRRLAQETLVHRMDVERAIGEVTPVDTELATDGIREYLEIGLRVSSSRPNRVYPERTLHLHRTDGEGEWMLARGEAGETSLVVTQEHGKGDAAVRGAAAELLWWIWGRPSKDVQVFGDPTVARAWQDLAP